MDNQTTTNIGNFGIYTGAAGNVTANKINVTINPSAPGATTATRKNPLRFNIPKPTSRFKGRRDTMEAVRNYFITLPPQPKDCWERIVAIVGLGGMGKTETAYKFAAEFKETFPNVAWINAETKSSAAASFRGLANRLRVDLKDRCSDLQIVKDVYLHLDQEDNGSVLFIFDNAIRLHSDDTEFGIMEYLPTDDLPNQRFPYVLITTQTQDWERRIQTFQVDELREVESLEFFRSCFQIESAECDDVFRKLHKLLEGYPLVMNLAASNIDFNPKRNSAQQLKQHIQNYIDKLEKENNKILHEKLNRAWPTKYNKILANVWQLTFERIQQEENGRDALELLQLMSFLHVPIESNKVVHMLALGSDCPHPSLTELEFRLKELIRILERFYTLRILEVYYDDEEEFRCELGIHRLVQFVVRQQMDSSKGLERVLFKFARDYNYTYYINKSALEEALHRIPLSQQALPYVGCLACHGFTPACKFVETRPPETKAAKTIWRLYSLKRGMKTLDENATQVLRELIELIKSAERLADRYFFGDITMELLTNKHYCIHTRDDGTEAPGFFDLDSLDGIEELVAELICNIYTVQDLSCVSEYCDLHRKTSDFSLVSLIVKLSKAFIQLDASDSMLTVDVISDIWFALFALLKYYEPHEEDLPYFFEDFWRNIYDAFHSPNASQSRIGALKTCLWDRGLAEELIHVFGFIRDFPKGFGSIDSLWLLRMIDFCIDGMDMRDQRVQKVISSICQMAARVEKQFIPKGYSYGYGSNYFTVSFCSFWVKLFSMNQDPHPHKSLDSLSQLKFLVWVEQSPKLDEHDDPYYGQSMCRVPYEYRSNHFPQFIQRFSSSDIEPIKTLVDVIRRLMEDDKKCNLKRRTAPTPDASKSSAQNPRFSLAFPLTDNTMTEDIRSKQTFGAKDTSFKKIDAVDSSLDVFFKDFKVTKSPTISKSEKLPLAIALRQPSGTSTVTRTPPFCFSVPTPTRHFTGRRKTMEDIRDYFMSLPPQSVDCWERIVAIAGQGGMGKTEIASKFSADNRTAFPNAVWVNAESEHGTLKSFLELAKDLRIVEQDRKSADLSLVVKVYRHIDKQDYDNFLLIFDNAILLQSEGTQSGIYDYLPIEDLPNQRFPHIIITTHATEWIREFKSIQVGPLAETESLEFFRSLFKIVSPVCDGVFKKLHELLQGHPLLVNLAASQIDHDSIKDSVYQLQQHINRFIERVKNEQNGALGDKMNPTGTALDNKLLSILCQMAFQRLQQEENGPEALELLQILSFLNLPIRSVDVKTILVCSTECPHLPDLELESRLEKLIQVLERFSITRILKRGRRGELCELGLNELVQSAVRQTTDCTKALERVLSYLTYGPYWKDVVNTSALGEGLRITQLSSHTLPYVGILACDGIRAASQIVETREPETKTAATIWRLYHLERGTTLNVDAVQVLGELVELTQSPVQLKHRHLFAQIAMLMLLDAEGPTHEGDDGTTVPQYLKLTTFDGIEELVARLILNICSFDESLCESEVCGVRREDLDENVAAIAAKLSKTFINVNGPKQPSAVQLLADTWLAVLGMLKYYNLDTQNGVPYFWTKFWRETHKILNSLGVSERVIVELTKRLWDRGLAKELIKAFKSVRFASKVVSSYFKECFDVCLDGMTLEDDRVKEVIAAFTEMAAKTQLNIFDSNSNDAINFAIDVCSVYVRLLLLDPAPRSTVLLGYLSRCEALTWIQETGEDGMHRKIKIIHWCRICEKYRSAYFPQFIARYSSTEVQEIQQLVALCRRIMKIGKL